MKVLTIDYNDIKSSMRLDSSYHITIGNIYFKKLIKFPYKKLIDYTEKIFTSGRGKRMYVSKERGYPYFSNSDIVKQNPFYGCKYISNKINFNDNFFLKEGTILTGRVGAIGQTAITNSQMETSKVISSDNIIKIISKNYNDSGFLFTFLISKYGQALILRLSTGGVQPYISEEMLYDLPIPTIPKAKQQKVHDLIMESSQQRVEANQLLMEAVTLFEKNIGESKVHLNYQYGTVPYKKINTYYKRFDAQYQLANQSLDAEKKENLSYKKIGDFAESIFIGNRSKRIYTEKGVPYLSSAEMMSFNPRRLCKNISFKTPNLNSFLVYKDDILIARSGTVISGEAMIINNQLNKIAVSDDAIRLKIDKAKIKPQYVFCYLKTEYGKKRLKSATFGSAIIHLNESLLSETDIPIINDKDYKTICNKIQSYQDNIDDAVYKESQAIQLVEKEIESWEK